MDDENREEGCEPGDLECEVPREYPFGTK